MLRLPYVLLASLLLSQVSAAEEWARFRGPNGLGVSETAGIPATWTEADYRWKAKLSGVGSSSPVVWGERLFVTSASEENGTQFIQCLRTSDGSPLWQREYTTAVYPKHKFNMFAASTPAADAECLYCTWTTPEEYTVVCLRQQSGEEVWRRGLGPFVAEHGSGASPIVVGDLLIVPNDQDGVSNVAALECRSGKTRWEVPRKSEKTAYATPCLLQCEGGEPQLVLASWAHGITALDPATGKLIWELPLFQHRVVTSPVVASGLIVCSAGVGGVGRRMAAVRPADPAKNLPAKVVYDVDTSIPYVPMAVSRGDHLFLWSDRGIIACLDGPTGKVLWRERVGGDYFSSPLRIGDRLYNVSRTGKVVVLAASDKFQKLAEIDLGEPTNATPAVAADTLFLRTASQVMALGAK